jgi:hypothetical protein
MFSQRTDKTGTYYSGALCGLGFDKETGTGMYNDNDIGCFFESKFYEKDIKAVWRQDVGLVFRAFNCFFLFGKDQQNTSDHFVAGRQNNLKRVQPVAKRKIAQGKAKSCKIDRLGTYTRR